MANPLWNAFLLRNYVVEIQSKVSLSAEVYRCWALRVRAAFFYSNNMEGKSKVFTRREKIIKREREVGSKCIGRSLYRI